MIISKKKKRGKESRTRCFSYLYYLYREVEEGEEKGGRRRVAREFRGRSGTAEGKKKRRKKGLRRSRLSLLLGKGGKKIGGMCRRADMRGRLVKGKGGEGGLVYALLFVISSARGKEGKGVALSIPRRKRESLNIFFFLEGGKGGS